MCNTSMVSFGIVFHQIILPVVHITCAYEYISLVGKIGCLSNYCIELRLDGWAYSQTSTVQMECIIGLVVFYYCVLLDTA